MALNLGNNLRALPSTFSYIDMYRYAYIVEGEMCVVVIYLLFFSEV